MCGRIALYTPPQRLARLLEAALAAGVDPVGEPSWNVGPQRDLFGVSSTADGRVLDTYRWGLVPWWSTEGTAQRTFNARAETVATRSMFRDAYRRRQRLLVPVDGFFEWDHRDGTKVPHFFTRADGAPIVLAGLYDLWRDRTQPRDTERLRTCTVITTTPSADVDGIHDRMPVVLDSEDFDQWLTGDADDALHALLAPAPRGTLVHHEVDRRVGNVANDGPELIAAAS